MHCSSGVTRIELALQMTPGVLSARANLGPNAVDVEYDPSKVDFDAIRRAIESAGHKVAEPKAADVRAAVERSEEHTSELQSLMRISYAVFCLKKHKYYIPNTL